MKQAIARNHQSLRQGKTSPSNGRLTLTRVSTVAIALLGPVMTGAAADNATATAPAPQPTPALTKPAWLTDLSLGVKETYDDNIFAAGAGRNNQGWNPAYVTPAGSVAALKGTDSFVTTVSPKLGVNFAPLLGDQKTVQSLSLAYNPDFVTYHQASSESYNIHRLIGGVKIKADAFSATVDNTLSLIDGGKFGAFYPGALSSAQATPVVRERRDQDQDRAAITLKYDQEKWFLRPVATLINYDLKTEQINTTGYQNFVDRHDINGGADFGYKITPKVAATIGYRYGNQYQQALLFDAHRISASSDYQRVLLGVEGKPLDWLELKVQGGPDFRSYKTNAPVNDRNMITYYGEASITATVTPSDTVSFKYKQYQWVSSTGRSPYFDSLFDLSYRRKLVDGLFVDIGGKLLESDYTSGLTNLKSLGGTTKLQDDALYSISAGLTYAFSPNASVNVAYTANLARNFQSLPATTDASGREYDDNQVSVGATFKF